MIVRPDNLRRVDCRITFNFLKFDEIEIDLDHINQGARSNFTIEQISKIVSFNLEGKILKYSKLRIFGEEFCEYYVVYEITPTKTFKLVFCVCSDRPKSIGVITFYRVKGKIL